MSRHVTWRGIGRERRRIAAGVGHIAGDKAGGRSKQIGRKPNHSRCGAVIARHEKIRRHVAGRISVEVSASRISASLRCAFRIEAQRRDPARTAVTDRKRVRIVHSGSSVVTIVAAESNRNGSAIGCGG